jgi:hypothetical protein
MNAGNFLIFSFIYEKVQKQISKEESNHLMNDSQLTNNDVTVHIELNKINSYQKLKRSLMDRHTKAHGNCIEIF